MVESIAACTVAPVARLTTLPARTASEMVMQADAPQLRTGRPAGFRTPSKDPKRKVRSLKTRHPPEAPNWFCLKAFLERPLALVKKLAASSLSLRRKLNAL